MAWCYYLQDAINQLRGVSSCRGEGGGTRSGDSIETLQSRTRELEKKVCLYVL